MLFEAIHFGITCAKLTFGAFAPGYEHCCVSLASKKPRRVKYDQLRCRPPRRWHWPCDKTVVAERDTGESSVLMNTATDVNSTVEAGVCGLHGRRPTRTAHLCLGQLSLQLRPRIGCLQGTLIVVWYNSAVVPFRQRTPLDVTFSFVVGRREEHAVALRSLPSTASSSSTTARRSCSGRD